MTIYRFEVSAFEEIDIEAETRKEAEVKAKQYFNENFKSMFGGVEFIEEVERWTEE